MILSILICTLKNRVASLSELLSVLIPQCGRLIEKRSVKIKSGSIEVIIYQFKNVEILTASDNRSITTGSKRNLLTMMASGVYQVFIDDDDMVPGYYVEEILGAARSQPDCIGMNGVITTNGANEKKWFISREYGHWFTKDGIYYRTPNHISPVRRTIALQCPFPNTSSGEDSAFSEAILPLLHTEALIDKPMYYYNFMSPKRDTHVLRSKQ